MSCGLPNLESLLLRAGIAVLPDHEATMFSEQRAVTLLKCDTRLSARQSWLSCKAATLIPQAGGDSLSRKRTCLHPGLANERGAHQPKGEGRQREGLREDKRNVDIGRIPRSHQKEARARNLTPGKNRPPTSVPTRPHLTPTQQGGQAHWSSTAESG